MSSSTLLIQTRKSSGMFLTQLPSNTTDWPGLQPKKVGKNGGQKSHPHVEKHLMCSKVKAGFLWEDANKNLFLVARSLRGDGGKGLATKGI